MKIDELIANLTAIRDKHGSDVEVVVQYRDSGGDYYGCDAALRCLYSENELISADVEIDTGDTYTIETQDFDKVLRL